MPELIPVLIVDDQLIQREGITRVVEATGVMRVVGAVSSGAEAAQVIRLKPVQLVLVDLVLRHEHGTGVGRQLLHRDPRMKVIIYTRERSMVLAGEIFRDEKELGEPGLHGYMLTRNISSSDYLLQVYQRVLDNGHFIDPDVLRWHYQFAKLERLTPREEECARLISKGLGNAQIAEAMVVSRRRVENLINSLYQKFQILGDSGDPARRVILVESIRLLNNVRPIRQAMSILIVDDQAEDRARLWQALTHDPRFSAVVQAEDGKRGIEAASRQRPEVALIDIHLPDMNGFEAARRILEYLPQTMIILTSGERSPLYEELAVQAGAVAFVPKAALTPDSVYHACDFSAP